VDLGTSFVYLAFVVIFLSLISDNTVRSGIVLTQPVQLVH